MAFRDEGYAIDIANTTENAIQLGTVGEYMAVLIDLQEKTFDAFRICAEIKAKRFKSRIIAMTGFNGIYGCEECYKAGFSGFFAKPCDVQDLIHVARDAVLGKIKSFR